MKDVVGYGTSNVNRARSLVFSFWLATMFRMILLIGLSSKAGEELLLEPIEAVVTGELFPFTGVVCIGFATSKAELLLIIMINSFFMVYIMLLLILKFNYIVILFFIQVLFLFY